MPEKQKPSYIVEKLRIKRPDFISFIDLSSKVVLEG